MLSVGQNKDVPYVSNEMAKATSPFKERVAALSRAGFTAEQIVEKVPEISRATIYRHLKAIKQTKIKPFTFKKQEAA